MKIQVEVFWDLTSCSDIVENQCFGVPCYPHLQGEVKILRSIFGSKPNELTSMKLQEGTEVASLKIV
jgi:hypothetical protein